MSKTIAILTGGGDCPGLNAVIRGVVRSAILQRGWRVLGIEDGFDGLVGQPRFRTLDLASVRGILPRGGTILGTSNRGNPFQYPREIDGKSALVDVSAEVVQNFKAIGADALIAVGGDGTLKIARALNERGIPVVGVPKTIDNDLRGTDVTFGYNTAVGIVTEALDRLHTTAESHQRVMVVEVMGRDAGWIALESGLAGSADVILIPEIPFDLDKVCQSIRKRSAAGSRFSIVVVAEGAFPAGGDKVTQLSAEQNLGVERLGGIGQFVSHHIRQCLDMEVRTVVLGHVQRGGTPSSFDRILSSRFGVKAVELIEQGRFGNMVALRGREVVAVEIEKAVGALNLVDPEGDLVKAAEDLGVMLGR
ncbi:MAG: 6-phosphofructokinase [Desulfuromonadales bacterium]|nr:6-phosphofructokinase [Desulfuromonadales bacterium]MDW7758458.1 6-phosphofructokinase [Desulfuromonadales bacterium]